MVFQFGLGDDWLKGARSVGELEGTISLLLKFPDASEALHAVIGLGFLKS